MASLKPMKETEGTLCCCNPEIPHNEEMKFKLIPSDGNHDI